MQGERLAGQAAAARDRLAAQLAAVVLGQAATWRLAGRHTEALALLGRALAVEPGQPALQAALAVGNGRQGLAGFGCQAREGARGVDEGVAVAVAVTGAGHPANR